MIKVAHEGHVYTARRPTVGRDPSDDVSPLRRARQLRATVHHGRGWRQVHVCAVCGHRAVGPAGRRVAVGAVAAAAVLALARAVRRRL
ncbi:hypothetical protein [Halosegnis marinus]|uniref:hypothetical protein n=1 Tax=Halosegnis marinus TaxID=3034023 RepID=UPI003614A563